MGHPTLPLTVSCALKCTSRFAAISCIRSWGVERAMQVPDVYAACKRFQELGVVFQKEPDAGAMKGLAFIRDPDGYWIEVLNAKTGRGFHNWSP